ncbi:hypothetical protein F5Y15DRAFT_428249 [Xylariaceae sp. FL0016]|nr:hypothetical protein F5Y15DRAFT_428249 [Xylariaceae sp. FL0016]
MTRPNYIAITGVAVIACLLGVLMTPRSAQSEPPYIEPKQGRNETSLFLMNAEYGLSNVHLATMQAMLERHPNIKIHAASFPRSADKVARVFTESRTKSPIAQGITFHELHGPEFMQAMSKWLSGDEKSVQHIMAPPGLKGIDHMMKTIEAAISPWAAEDHVKLYRKAVEIIDRVDPSVVVLDMVFRPVSDAARQQNRLYAYLTPNVLLDSFVNNQPYNAMWWKMASGISFPVPWYKIPMNIYFTRRFRNGLRNMPTYEAISKDLEAHDISRSSPLSRPGDLWISQDMPGASVPLDYAPPNATGVGPITYDGGLAKNQDSELVAWLAKGPTVLVNLGSLFTYNEQRAAVMAQALKILMDRTDVQILWKLGKESAFGDSYTEVVEEYIAGDRLRIKNWLTVNPVSLMDTGHIVASVHHGGANCYYEAIAAGVPQIVIPMWLDTYNYAHLAEYVGVGIFAMRDTTPDWTVEGLVEALMRVLGGEHEGLRMKEKARHLGKVAQRKPGRYEAARLIARLAESGYAWK